jgi:hypothetical protein
MPKKHASKKIKKKPFEVIVEDKHGSSSSELDDADWRKQRKGEIAKKLEPEEEPDEESEDESGEDFEEGNEYIEVFTCDLCPKKKLENPNHVEHHLKSKASKYQ